MGVAAILISMPLAACRDRDAHQSEAAHGVAFAKGAGVIGDAIRLAIGERQVAVWDHGSNSLYLFDRYTRQRLAIFGRQGSGPGEFRAVRSLQFLRREEGLETWLYDAGNMRLTGVALTHDSMRLVNEAPSLSIPSSTIAVQWLNDTLLAAVGFFPDGRYALLNVRGSPAQFRGLIPQATDRALFFAMQQALQASLAIQPGGQRLAIGSRYAARVDLYEALTGEMVAARVPFPFEAEFRVRTRGTIPMFESTVNTRFGYIGVTATAERVYALFSGRTLADYPGRANSGRAVHMFDWSGGFLGVVDLEHDAIEISVAPDGRELFAIHSELEPEVVSYRLSP